MRKTTPNFRVPYHKVTWVRYTDVGSPEDSFSRDVAYILIRRGESKKQVTLKIQRYLKDKFYQ